MGFIIITIIIFIYSSFARLLGVYGYKLYLFKDYSIVRFNRNNKEYNLKTKHNSMTYKQTMYCLGTGIITGMLSFIPMFFLYGTESSIAIIIYLIFCSNAFYNIIKLQVRINKDE